MALTTFTSGQVLTAAQMNAVQANDYNQTVSTKTASYTLVAADKGTRVVMNSASATTITVNTSLFSAGDTLFLQNISTGVCTVTAGTATVSSAGPLAIPQNGSGTLYFTSAGVSIYYPSAVTATASGLTLVTPTSTANSGGSVTTTGGKVVGTACNSFSLNGVFTATYDNYLIQINSASASTAGVFNIKLRAAGTDLSATYYWGLTYVTWGASTAAQGGNNLSTGWKIGSFESPVNSNIVVQNPFLSVAKGFIGQSNTSDAMQTLGGINTSTASHDGFTLASSAGTVTATVRVFGYQAS